MKALYVLMTLVFISCSSQKEAKSLPFSTDEVYFQKWIGGQRLTGSGTDFYIRFKEPFSVNFKIKKLYFHGRELEVIKRNDSVFTASYSQRPNVDQELNETDGQIETPKVVKSKFELKNNEAILEFEQDSKTQFFKITNIKEKELLAYPSAKPRN
ncbi:hypothetical protein [Flavobacterium sp.]|uniref:hypothetical protein n=1 Tax=Flavobacterium sp. TaxID=239 RepID=UPI002608EDFD|nr:hypothetical protein [Flavobacterium sp.]